MTNPIRFAALLTVMLTGSISAAPPAPSPTIIGVKADGSKNVARIVFLGFDANSAPRAPDTLRGRLYFAGRSTWVMLHRRWQGAGAVAGGWVPADYLLEAPYGASGEAVLSLDGRKEGWSFQLRGK